tara:strand:+ start:295 stop:822 length:528 start_codon:yes stop_codon:yes gene_type:complete
MSLTSDEVDAIIAFDVQIKVICVIHAQAIDSSVIATVSRSRKQDSLAEWIDRCQTKRKLLLDRARTKQLELRKALSQHSKWCDEIDAGAHVSEVGSGSFKLGHSRKKTRMAHAFGTYSQLSVSSRTDAIATDVITSLYDEAPDCDNDMYGYLHNMFHVSHKFNTSYSQLLYSLIK